MGKRGRGRRARRFRARSRADAGPGWDYEADTRWARLAAAGVIDELSDLQIILSQWSEVFPIHLYQICAVLGRSLVLAYTLDDDARPNVRQRQRFQQS